jgi:hypothetical protein
LQALRHHRGAVGGRSLLRNTGPVAGQRWSVAGPRRPPSLRRKGLRRYRHSCVGRQLSVLDQLREERALRCSWVV